VGSLPARPRRSASDDGIAPLAGYSVAVVSDRRRHPLADLLESLGGRTVGVQGARSLPQADEARVRDATAAVLAQPCDELIVSSVGGLRHWLQLARHWRVADELVARFADARLLARDARVADSLRELGLTMIWSTAGAATEELFRYLAAQSLAGRRVVAQLDTESLRDQAQSLRAAGADVVEVPTYQVFRPTSSAVLRRLGEQIVNRQIDAVALVGESTTVHLLDQAAADRRAADVLNSLCDGVLCGCLGEPTARPLRAQGVEPLTGTGPYIEELADQFATALPRLALRVELTAYRLEVRGQAVILNGTLIPVQAGPIAVLRALARQPGRVVSCAELRSNIPTWSDVDDHAIEMAVMRLRRSLPGVDLVQTVMKRGYRLAG
jgi:uroporphyrinogen-III synthase